MEGARVGKMSRTKGAAAERELFKLLSDELGFVVRRNVDQARAGGADGVEVPGIAIEVKRREALSIPAWWRQTCKQAQDSKRLPILFYRQSRKPWSVVIPKTIEDWSEVRTDFQEGMKWIRENMTG